MDSYLLANIHIPNSLHINIFYNSGTDLDICWKMII